MRLTATPGPSRTGLSGPIRTPYKMSNDNADIVTLLRGGAISSLLNKDSNLPHADLKGNSALIWCADSGQVILGDEAQKLHFSV
jgi:hypothetical protein